MLAMVLRVGCVNLALLKAARPQMAMQTFAAIAGSIRMDRLRWLANILGIKMMQPAQPGLHHSEIQHVVGMAGVTRLVVSGGI